MRKIIALIIVMCATIEMAFTQPVKTTFGFATQQYVPEIPAPKPIVGPRGPRGVQGIQGIPGKTDTIFFQPVLEDYPTIAETFQIIGDEIRPVQTQYDSVMSAVMALRAQENYRLNDIQDNLAIHKLRASGRAKILSGIGLQVAALGVLVASQIETTTVVNVMTKYEVPYTYTEYEISNTTVTSQIVNTPPNTGNKPGNGHHSHGRIDNNGNVVINTTITTPKITPITKTGTVDFTVNDLAPVVQQYNKNPFYISAGILAGAGVVLEVLGIIDLHNANVYITQNSVGMTLKF